MLDSSQAGTGRAAATAPAAGVGGQLQSALSRTLRWASRAEVRRALQGPQAQPLSATDAWLLDAIVMHDGVRVSQLAQWQGVDKSTVTPQVHRLEARGLITRCSSAADRRVVLLGATEQGRALHSGLAAAGAQYMDDVLAHWTARDRQLLATLLSRLADELDQRTAPPASRPALGEPDWPGHPPA